MSTVHQPRESEERTLPPGFDPTRGVLEPQGAPPLPPRYRPLAGRAAAITAMFGLLLVLDLVLIGASLLNLEILDRLDRGENVPGGDLDANDTRLISIGLGHRAVTVACVVLFIRWLYLAYRNTDAISPSCRRFDTGWAIGGWFVPILFFWRPKQIVNDVWRSGTLTGKRPPLWLAAWWLAFWGRWFYGRVADADGTGGSLAQLRETTDEVIVGSSINIVAIALAIVVVRSLTKRQEARAEEVAARQYAPLPGAAPAPA